MESVRVACLDDGARVSRYKDTLMKLVIFNDIVYDYARNAPSGVGGAERYQWLLARALAGSGWSIKVGVRDGLAVGERATFDRVEFVGLSHSHTLKAWYRFMISERPQWWHWQCAYHLLGPAVELARLAGVRTIFSTMHDRDLHPSRALNWRRNWWPLYALGLLRSHRILVQHSEQLAELAPQLRARASILPGIVAQPVTIKPHADRSNYVAWVAMLRQPKRPDILLEIARNTPSVRFVVCGAPTTHRSEAGYGERIGEALRALPNVDYLGQVAPQQALDIISEAALLLSTSDEEGFPSTFLEAWASGTPVVSMKIDPDHVIQQYGLGAVSGSIETAITDITALINSSERRAEIGARARRHIANVHSEAAVVKAFEGAIQEIPKNRVSLCASAR
jgi:glycosyltransferase involved in cell wall biosynthesis